MEDGVNFHLPFSKHALQQKGMMDQNAIVAQSARTDAIAHRQQYASH